MDALRADFSPQQDISIEFTKKFSLCILERTGRRHAAVEKTHLTRRLDYPSLVPCAEFDEEDASDDEGDADAHKWGEGVLEHES